MNSADIKSSSAYLPIKTLSQFTSQTSHICDLYLSISQPDKPLFRKARKYLSNRSAMQIQAHR